MALIKDSYSNMKDKIAFECDEPSEHVQSEGERLIKDLVKKQTDTNVQLQEQLLIQKDFEKSGDLVPLASFPCGETSLENFKQHSNLLDNVEELRRCGLTTFEIKLLMDSQKGQQYLIDKHRNICKFSLLRQIDEICQKINIRKVNDEIINDSISSVSRHTKEIGLSVKPNSNETRLYQFALTSSTLKIIDNTPLHHPINHLKDLENDLLSQLNRINVPPLAKRRKKLKKLDEFQNNSPSTSIVTVDQGKINSKWDMKETPVSKRTHSKLSVLKTSKVYNCKPQNFYTIKDGKIVHLTNINPEITGDLNIQTFEDQPKYTKQLNEEDIRNMHQFRNYERGIPSKVLYIKNIGKCTEDEFKNLFKMSINQEEIACRLLTGKMKGQAFITFKSEEQATEALIKYNGFILNGKPMVIAYGKSQS